MKCPYQTVILVPFAQGFRLVLEPSDSLLEGSNLGLRVGQLRQKLVVRMHVNFGGAKLQFCDVRLQLDDGIRKDLGLDTKLGGLLLCRLSSLPQRSSGGVVGLLLRSKPLINGGRRL